MKLYGHPWSINTRKALVTLAEKGHDAELVLIMVPKGEHKHPEHVARHPFGKVPVLDDGGFVLYETRAINRYLDKKLGGAPLTPSDDRGAARVDQWVNVADSYFIPHAHPLIVEAVFRRYLGGEQNAGLMRASRDAMQPALDVAEKWLATNDYFAGPAFSLADIHWMPYLEYLSQSGEGESVGLRKNLRAWWNRVSERASWQKVARTGPQPYEKGMTADVIEKAYRK
ncbi:MAG: glutathione S-transferase N-terminal domain-containing protein [Polyangiaceae bacterium]